LNKKPKKKELMEDEIFKNNGNNADNFNFFNNNGRLQQKWERDKWSESSNHE